MISRRSFVVATVMSGLAVPTEAAAQAYPSRLVTLIVPSAGSTPDLLARLLADKLRPMMGQDFIVEIGPVPAARSGPRLVARATPDGHVLLCTTEWLFFSHLMNQRLSFRPACARARQRSPSSTPSS